MLPFHLFILHRHSLRKGRNVGSITGISIIRFCCSCNSYILDVSFFFQFNLLFIGCILSVCLCLVLVGRSEFCIGIGDGGHISGHCLDQLSVFIQFPGFILLILIHNRIDLTGFGLLIIVSNNDAHGSVVLDHFISVYRNNSSVVQTFFHIGNTDRIPVSLHILIRIGLLILFPFDFLNSLLKDHDIVLGSLVVIHHIVVILCLRITILIGIGYFKIILGIIVFTLNAFHLGLALDATLLGQIVVLHNGNEKLILIFPVQSVIAPCQSFLIGNNQSTFGRGIHCTLCSLQSLCQCFCICLRCCQLSCCCLSVSICTVYSILIGIFIICHLLCCLFISCLGSIVLSKLCIEICLCLIHSSSHFLIGRICLLYGRSILDHFNLSVYSILCFLHGILCLFCSLFCISCCISCFIQFCIGKLIIFFRNTKSGICILNR